MRLMQINLSREPLTLIEGAPYLLHLGDNLFVAKGIFMATGNAARMKPGWYLYTREQFYKPKELRALYRIVRT